MQSDITNYDAAVSYLNNSPRFTEKHTIEQTRRMLMALGSPQRSFRAIHVAGSNGKGSVCMMLSSILRRAGYRCGLFTSPHLITTRERFVIDGEMVTEEQFLEDFLHVRRMLGQHPELSHPSYFEYLFLMAMLRFRKAGVDAAVLETGLGGRLDATNALEKPDVCVITSISLEHTEYLGSSIGEIAAEKAGIIKPHVPVFYDAGLRSASEVIERIAREKEAPACGIAPEDIDHVRAEGNGIAFACAGVYDLYQLKVPSRAAYQVMNAALAAQAAECFLMRSSSDQVPGVSRAAVIREGIERCRFPGRMEEKDDGIFLDGAHNPAGMKAFLSAVRGMSGGRQILVFSCLKDKNYRDMTRQIRSSGLWDTIFVTKIDSTRAADPEEIAALLLDGTCSDIRLVTQPQEAVSQAKRIRKKGQYIFAAGSLYLIGMLESRL